MDVSRIPIHSAFPAVLLTASWLSLHRRRKVQFSQTSSWSHGMEFISKSPSLMRLAVPCRVCVSWLSSMESPVLLSSSAARYLCTRNFDNKLATLPAGFLKETATRGKRRCCTPLWEPVVFADTQGSAAPQCHVLACQFSPTTA